MAMVKTEQEKVKQDFEQLKLDVMRLNELLKDPQFGLSSWCRMYAERMKAISDYWVNN